MTPPANSLDLRREDGQALVELALVLPLLLMLLFGLFEFGRAYNYWIDQTHLANQAARFAAVDYRPGGGGTSITQYVKNQATTGELRDGTGSVSPGLRVCITTTGIVGDPVTVTATSTYHWLPILGLDSILSTTLTGRATMRVEKAPSQYTSGECA